VELLMDLAGDREWEVRATLMETLGRLGDHRALPTVLQLLKDRDAEVRQNAADALGRLGDETAIESLMMAMVDEHPGVRQAALRSASMVDPYWERSSRAQALLPRIQTAIHDREPGVQLAAANLMRRLTGRSAVEILAAEASAAVSQGDELVDLFRPLLEDSDECVRLAAAEALGRLARPAAVPPLQLALADQSKWVRQAVEQSLEVITTKMAR
jgi:HEAT repeat protein